MRKSGFALLILGFLWLVYCATSIRPLARSIVVRQYDQLAKQKSFSLEQVQQNIRDPMFRLVDSIPWILPPAVLMLAAGILLDRAKK
jgi:hypothetical protein